MQTDVAAGFDPARFDAEQFLRDYWQKKPLLIKNPWRAWSNPLEPDELAGLACEEEVESRIVLTPSAQGKRKQWTLEHGPFPERRFSKLSEQNWTLLVQAVDHYVPEVAELLEAFAFIPRWRIDDIMVSYAADGGGVGPHFDRYDVFLIQGLGRRRWQVGALCDDATALLPHDELRLLADFEAQQEWVLEPGDILYLPPGYAHNGVAVGSDCMTYSVGLRAPGRAELIGHWSDHVIAQLSEDDRYRDIETTIPANPGEISTAALIELQALTLESLSDSAAFQQWFGKFNTARKYPELDRQPDVALTAAQLQKRLCHNAPLLRHPASRFAFIRPQEIHQSVNAYDTPEATKLWLFADGEAFRCDATTAVLAQRICAGNAYTALPIDSDLSQSEAALTLLLALYNQGSLVFGDDD